MGSIPRERVAFAARRRGWTLIELLVVLGILGVLAGLILPAVQRAREAARRSQCVSNLRQIMVAMERFAATHGAFPTGVHGPPYTRADALYPSAAYSVHLELLSALDETAIFNAINDDINCNVLEDVDRENQTAARQTIAVFLCPSDPNARAGTASLGPNSYRGSLGLNPQKRDEKISNRFRWGEDGLFGYVRATRPLAAVTDGLSNTLAFSEKPVASSEDRPSYSAFRDWIKISASASAASADEYLAECSQLNESSGAAQFTAGRTWLLSGACFTLFYVGAPPNSPIPDCGHANANGVGLFTARSYHPGGVNAAMADGSVRWVSSSIDPRLWRGLGTRAGGEPVEP